MADFFLDFSAENKKQMRNGVYEATNPIPTNVPSATTEDAHESSPNTRVRCFFFVLFFFLFFFIYSLL